MFSFVQLPEGSFKANIQQPGKSFDLLSTTTWEFAQTVH